MPSVPSDASNTPQQSATSTIYTFCFFLQRAPCRTLNVRLCRQVDAAADITCRTTLLDLDDDALELVVRSLIKNDLDIDTSTEDGWRIVINAPLGHLALPLASTCKRFRALAMSAAYGTLYDWNEQLPLGVGSRRALRLLATTLQIPIIAKTVRIFHIALVKQSLPYALDCLTACRELAALTISVEDWEEPEDFAWVEPCQRLASALQTRGNLQKLYINGQWPGSKANSTLTSVLTTVMPPSLVRIGIAGTGQLPCLPVDGTLLFPQLQTLHLGEVGSTTSHLSALCGALLPATQPGALRHLKIVSYASEATFTLGFIPRAVLRGLESLAVFVAVNDAVDRWSDLCSLERLSVGARTPFANGRNLDQLPPTLKHLNVTTDSPECISALSRALDDPAVLPMLTTLALNTTNLFFHTLRADTAAGSVSSNFTVTSTAVQRLQATATARCIALTPAALEKMIKLEARAWRSRHGR